MVNHLCYWQCWERWRQYLAESIGAGILKCSVVNICKERNQLYIFCNFRLMFLGPLITHDSKPTRLLTCCLKLTYCSFMKLLLNRVLILIANNYIKFKLFVKYNSNPVLCYQMIIEAWIPISSTKMPNQNLKGIHQSL